MAHMGKRGSAYCISTVKREDMGPLGRLRFRRKDNIKIDV